MMQMACRNRNGSTKSNALSAEPHRSKTTLEVWLTMADSIVTRKAFKYRIYPTKLQATQLAHTLDLCRELYNAALQERRDAYQVTGESITYHHQANQLTELKDIR